jgi:hypothetical protein
MTGRHNDMDCKPIKFIRHSNGWGSIFKSTNYLFCIKERSVFDYLDPEPEYRYDYKSPLQRLKQGP